MGPNPPKSPLELERPHDSDAPEPTHSEARRRVPAPSSEAPKRVSARPSAFGAPRGSKRPTGPMHAQVQVHAQAREPERRTPEPARVDERPRQTADSAQPRTATPRPPATLPESSALGGQTPGFPAFYTGAPSGFRGDVEELLPLPDASQSLPRIPLALLELPPQEPVVKEGRSALRISVFALALTAATLPVLRYTGVLERRSAAQDTRAAAAQPVKELAAVSPASVDENAAAPARLAPQNPSTGAVAVRSEPHQDPMLLAVQRIEESMPKDPEAASDGLVAEALRVMNLGDERLAETLLGRAIKLDEQNPRAAYALARVRFNQGNVEGAEGWVLVAIERRPRRAEYHELYATILERLGREDEAGRERHRARELKAKHSAP